MHQEMVDGLPEAILGLAIRGNDAPAILPLA